MGPVILVVLGIAAVVILVLYFLSRWATAYAQRVMTQRLEAVNEIVNNERVPGDWIKQYIDKINALKKKPDSQKVIARYKALAQKRCMANLDELIRFTEQTKYAETDDAKLQLLTALRAQRERWNDRAFWVKVFS